MKRVETNNGNALINLLKLHAICHIYIILWNNADDRAKYGSECPLIHWRRPVNYFQPGSILIFMHFACSLCRFPQCSANPLGPASDCHLCCGYRPPRGSSRRARRPTAAAAAAVAALTCGAAAYCQPSPD